MNEIKIPVDMIQFALKKAQDKENGNAAASRIPEKP